MTVDMEAMVRANVENYVAAVLQRDVGDASSSLRRLLETVNELFSYVEPGDLPHRVVILIPLPDSTVGLDSPHRDLRHLSDVRDHLTENFLLELRSVGSIRLHPLTVDFASLTSTAILYVLDDRSEEIRTRDLVHPVHNYSGSRSAFVRPYFEDLQDALDHYRRIHVRRSHCSILTRAWFDRKRLFLKRRPESHIRESLEQYLTSALRGNAQEVSVRPEQVVDDSHPADVQVVFRLSNRVALIEVKWMGQSRDDDRLWTAMRPADANSGAQQVADYIDAYRDRSPQALVRGYLVIIDARRRGLSATTSSISAANGMYFRDKDISFDPPVHELRDDVLPPYRMFVEPICEPSAV